jgi:rubredoxin
MIMNNEDYMHNRFEKWLYEHPGPYTSDEAIQLRDEAMLAIAESVKDGQITSLDGTESPLSKRICAKHEATNFEMNSNWVGSSQDWICPCCSRSKFQISRLGKKGQVLAKLVIHHDHMNDALEAEFHRAFAEAGTSVEQIDGWRLVERMRDAFAAHAEVLVCEDCNNADAEAKKLVGAAKLFSFSLGQIKRFIRPGDHRSHEIDSHHARVVWIEAMPAHTLRQQLISAVARAAATNAHWYEPHSRNADPIPVFGFSRRSVDQQIVRWANPDALLRVLGTNTRISAPNLTGWRQGERPEGKQPPPNYLAMLRTEDAHGQMWDALPDDWRCPICCRGKYEQVYLGEKGKVLFVIKQLAAKDAWASYSHMCNHCSSTLSSLKWEAVQSVGREVKNIYMLVKPTELSQIIVARPHSAHRIKTKEAAILLNVVAQRICETLPQ